MAKIADESAADLLSAVITEIPIREIMMQKKYILIILLPFCFLASFIFGWCYYCFFQYQTNINQLIEEASFEETELPANIVEIFRKLYQVENDRSGNVRLFMRCRNTRVLSHAEFAVQGLTWQILMPWTYSRTQRLSIYTHLMPFKDGNGLTYGAKYYFSKSLGELSEDEIIKLIAISRSPTNYSIDKSASGKSTFAEYEEELKSKLNN